MFNYEQGHRDRDSNREKPSPLQQYCGVEAIETTDGAEPVYTNLRQEWNYSLGGPTWFADIPTWGARGIYVGKTEIEARRVMAGNPAPPRNTPPRR